MIKENMQHNISVFEKWHIHCHRNINQGKCFLKFLKEPQHCSLLQEHWHSHHILEFLSKGTLFVLASTPLTTQTALLALQIEKFISFFSVKFSCESKWGKCRQIRLCCYFKHKYGYKEKFIRTLYEVCVCLMAHLISFICFSTFSYRKVVSNNCTAGVSTEYTARRQQCPIQAPKGLHLVTSEGSLTAVLGTNVTFLVFLEEVSCIQCFPWSHTESVSLYLQCK